MTTKHHDDSLPAWIIDELLRRERVREQQQRPHLDLPTVQEEDDSCRAPEEPARGVIIIPL